MSAARGGGRAHAVDAQLGRHVLQREDSTIGGGADGYGTHGRLVYACNLNATRLAGTAAARKDDRRCPMRRLMRVLFTVAVGAAAAYLLDPDRGRTRRALARDKAVAMSNRFNDALEGRSRHWSNIARGYLAEARRVLDRGRRPA